MNILYLTYGSWSGIVEHLSKKFMEKNVKVDILDAGKALNYRFEKFRIPSLKPKNLVNTILSAIK